MQRWSTRLQPTHESGRRNDKPARPPDAGINAENKDLLSSDLFPPTISAMTLPNEYTSVAAVIVPPPDCSGAI